MLPLRRQATRDSAPAAARRTAGTARMGIRAAGALALALATLLGSSIACSGRAGARKPHIFILNIDMLRADHLGVHGYGRRTTPELDRVAREGVWFTMARSHAPWTYPSVVSLLTGLYPSSHRAGYSKLGSQYVTTVVPASLENLATLLGRNGYTTAAFVTNPLLKRTSGLARGFDVFHDEFVGEERRSGSRRWWNESMAADNVHRALLAWLDEPRPEPRFAYVHYIDVHGPYLRPRAFGRPEGAVRRQQAQRARLSGEPRDLLIDVYDGELRHLDSLIGDLLRALEKRGILRDSIVIITSDHGEEFGDHGGHGHGHTLHEELLHVPLILARTDAMPHTRRIDEPVGHVDIVPTIADLVGFAAPENLPGSSLLPRITGRGEATAKPLLSEMDNRGRPTWNAKPGDARVAYALLLPSGVKYIAGGSAPLPPGGDLTAWSSQEEIYDLRSDPRETRRLEEAGDAGCETRRALEGVLASAKAVGVVPETAPIDSSTQDRLRALGYLPEEPTVLPGAAGKPTSDGTRHDEGTARARVEGPGTVR